jgi:hypothetical protein
MSLSNYVSSSVQLPNTIFDIYPDAEIKSNGVYVNLRQNYDLLHGTFEIVHNVEQLNVQLFVNNQSIINAKINTRGVATCDMFENYMPLYCLNENTRIFLFVSDAGAKVKCRFGNYKENSGFNMTSLDDDAIQRKCHAIRSLKIHPTKNNVMIIRDGRLHMKFV